MFESSSPGPTDPRDPSEHPVLAGMADTRAALAKLRATGTATMSDTECRQAVGAAAELCAAAQSEYLRLLRELDSRPEAVPGAAAGRVARTFLVHALHMSGADAARDVAAARAVDPASGSLPQLGQALEDGQVSRAHVDVAVRALRGVPRHLLERRDAAGITGAEQVDGFLTETAKVLSPQDTARIGAQLVAVLDPDGSDSFDPESVTRRGLRMIPDSTGMLLLRAELDPVAGEVVRAAIDRYAAPESAGTATDVNGHPVPLPDLRTPHQRQADALVSIARIALGQPAGHGSGDQQARIVITATPGQVAAAAASSDRGAAAGSARMESTGDPIGPRVLGRWLCDALLQRVLMAPGGAVLDLGRSQRTVSPAQRRALAARDEGCSLPGCHAPPGWCDAHHVVWWSAGGGTDLRNLALLCPRHHSEVHAGIWEVSMIDGVPWVRPPSWVDPQRRPLRNTTRYRVQQANDLGRGLLRDTQPGDTQPGDTQPGDTQPGDTQPGAGQDPGPAEPPDG